MKLSVHHDGKLKKAMDDNPLDTDYAFMYNRYHAKHLLFITAYNTWVAADGVQTGETMTLMQLLAALKVLVNAWIATSLTFYIKTTPRFNTLFGGGRKLYNQGAIDNRIQNVGSLSIRIGGDLNLAAVKTSVDATYAGLVAARNNQTGGKESNNSANANSKGNDCMDLQYGDCGILMNKFLATPLSIEVFFDRQLLSNTQQMKFTATMHGLEVKDLSERTVLSDDEFRFTLESQGANTVSATVYLASTPGGTDSTGIVITNHHEHKGKFAEFAITDYSLHRHITIVINSPAFTAKILFQYY